MVKATAAPTNVPDEGLLRAALASPSARLAAAMWLLCLLITAWPAATAKTNQVLAFMAAPPLFLGLATTFALLTRSRQKAASERRYWLHLALGLGIWAATYIPNILLRLAHFEVDAIRPFLDVGYGLSYLFVVAAVETRPDRAGWSAEAGSATPPWYAAILVAGLFSSLVLLPALLPGPSFPAFVSSFALYCALDLYIAGRALYLAQQSSSRQWRANFACLGAGYLLLLGSDLATSWLKRSHLPTTAGSYLDALWLLPFALLILAGGSASWRLADRRLPPREPTLSEAFAAPPLTWALCFPVFHFVAERLGWLDPRLAPPRDLLVLVSTLLLLGLAFYEQRRFEKELGRLVRERRDFEGRLGDNQNDLRLLLHRAKTAESLRAAEERYLKALDASALMEPPRAPEDLRRERVANLLENCRLPLRLTAAGSDAPGPVARANLPAFTFPAITMGAWQLLGPEAGGEA